MHRLIITLLTSGLLFAAYAQKKSADTFKGVIKYEDLQEITEKIDDVLVVNFWATWCGPCVREIPDFMEVNNKFSSRTDFKMILVSLDDKDNLKSDVIPFLKDNQITADVYLLDDTKRMNYWMPKVDKGWTGSIPATVFYKNGKKLKFVEKQFHKAELTEIIDQYLN
ncbi:MAG: TlpA family protein disulfide reductase [Paludibacter sp.]|nr:TlpA family protein disulfide reductase [Paludibacter sp.]MDD4199423.1 TlpA family protein disulfide reductase [Paludibacter sp.]MDD4429101.1 TlpA family protein disulfide reductase [Paludibacter sp.]